ncbi:MAG: Dps family protein [Thermoplasmatota archaeon]
MSPTKTAIDIGIPEDARAAIADGLTRVLADSYTLYLKTHGYHWNVTGPHFQALHALFETQYNELWIANDDLAERIRSLGFPAPGSGSALAAHATIAEADGVPSWDAMVADLAAGHEALIRTIRDVRPLAEEHADESTIALLDDRRSVSEKTAWMLRAHLE